MHRQKSKRGSWAHRFAAPCTHLAATTTAAAAAATTPSPASTASTTTTAATSASTAAASSSSSTSTPARDGSAATTATGPATGTRRDATVTAAAAGAVGPLAGAHGHEAGAGVVVGRRKVERIHKRGVHEIAVTPVVVVLLARREGAAVLGGPLDGLLLVVVEAGELGGANLAGDAGADVVFDKQDGVVG